MWFEVITRCLMVSAELVEPLGNSPQLLLHHVSRHPLVLSEAGAGWTQNAAVGFSYMSERVVKNIVKEHTSAEAG